MHTGERLGAAGVHMAQQGAGPITVQDCGAQHTRHSQVTRVDSSAIHLGRGVCAYQWFADLTQL